MKNKVHYNANLTDIAQKNIEDKEELLVKNCLDFTKAGILARKARYVYIWRQLYLTEATSLAITLFAHKQLLTYVKSSILQKQTSQKPNQLSHDL